ncbi:3'-5' exonuclease [Sphaerotilus sp.]|jgi:DNA polymerase-3 subunit epsilon|uniref:3'-5' exonuclease n=1 Tax=Sphaerotilus sp. TaxID=2093942 RepID=UPI00286E58F1|nr:3'-5' exonuclease [Sphaerotilus sp.]
MTGVRGGWLGPWVALQRAWMLWHLADQRLRFLYDEPPPNEWVSLDCETTGLDTRRDEIIAVGAVRIVGDRVMTSEALSLLVRPSKAVSADSVRIHRLREQDVAQGLEPEEAMRQLLTFVGSRPLVGYFLEFDVAMINRVLFPMLGVALPQPKIEISTLFYEHKRRLSRGPEQDRHIDLRFDTLMTELDLPRREAHDALNDAVMAALAFIKLRHLK